MIFDNPIFTEMILPFLLIFVVVFAILQRSKILGDGKKQIDSLTSLAVALLLIGVPAARDIVTSIVPWLAVGVTVLLMFFLLYGFVEKEVHDNMNKNIKNSLIGIIGAFMVGVLLWATPLGEILYDFLIDGSSSEVWVNVIMIAVIMGVVVVAVNGGNWGNKGNSG